MVFNSAFGGYQFLRFAHSLKKSNDIILMPLPLDTNFLASSGDRGMGESGKRDGYMNGY